MTVFPLMDAWLACTGSSEDAWLSLGLEVLEGWQTAGRLSTTVGDLRVEWPVGQPHLADTLVALRALRPIAAAPDPVGLATWFHHCGALRPTLLGRLAEVGGPALGFRVAWLVRGLASGGQPGGDAAALLLHTAHRCALSPSHLAPVRASPRDQ